MLLRLAGVVVGRVVVVMVVVGGPLSLLVHVQHVLLGDAGVQRQATGVHLVAQTKNGGPLTTRTK